MKKSAAILFLLLSVCETQSQHAWSLRAYPGFLAAHHEDMQAMGSHVLGLEAAREWRIDKEGELAKNQKQPFAGIGLNHIRLFNDISGNVSSLFGYYDAGFYGNEKTSYRFRLTTGIGLLSRQWDVYANPKNRAIGSRFNGMMQAAVYIQTPVSPRKQAQLGLSLIHYSNGNFGQPNLGINMPCLFLGIKQFDGNNRFYHPRYPENSNTVEWQPSLRFGKKQMSMDDPRNIFNYLAELKLLYPHKPHRFWTAAITGFYDRTYVYTKFQPLPESTADKITEIAISGGHEYRVGKVGVIADMGFYLYRPDNAKRRYYQALGVKYYASSKLSAMVRMRTHLSMADYLEWGVAYRLPTKTTVKPGFKEGFKWFFRGCKPRD
jgi:hypothetical protein